MTRSSTPKLHRPEISTGQRALPIDASMPAVDVAQRLVEGDYFRVADSYTTGTQVLAALDLLMPAPPADAGYPARREHRRLLRQASCRLLVQIHDHGMVLAGAPVIGFLPLLYADQQDYVLSFVDCRELNSAWNWYKKGIHLQVLGYRLHPFYGTYAPGRVSHLELFGTWLSHYDGPRGRALDVGTGCGVLALMLHKAGFSSVLATDNNPNAIESVRRDLAGMSPPPPLELEVADLLGSNRKPLDLVVFNPPWMQGKVEDMLDAAMYFEEGMFERFFVRAHARLAPNGRLVLLFSSLIQLVQPDLPHPIETELARGRFRLVEKLSRKPRGGPKKPGGGRRVSRERVEVWELARV